MTTPPAPIRARRTDPETSHAAAASIDLDTLRPKQQAVLHIVRDLGPMTDESLQTAYRRRTLQGDVPRQSESGVRTRRSELVEAGLVRDTGARMALSSGRKAILWEVVP